MAELPRLRRDELVLVKLKLDEVLKSRVATPAVKAGGGTWADSLLPLAGTVEGLPPDFAMNHDHYLHGTPRHRGV